MDFGQLIIRNHFETLQPDKRGHSAVVDVINLNLQNLQLSRYIDFLWNLKFLYIILNEKFVYEILYRVIPHEKSSNKNIILELDVMDLVHFW